MPKAKPPYIYRLGPIDDWRGWRDPALAFPIAGFWSFLASAFHVAAVDFGWEGDIREGEGPFVTILPTDADDATGFAIAWKQDNNGTTFLASTHPLDWLEKSRV